MAHFAQLDDNNNVLNVVVVNNEDLQNLEFPESEPVGIEFLSNLFQETKWKQTSYNNNFRKRYAGIGFYYSDEHDAFIPPKLYDSFVFDIEALEWVPPISYPNDGLFYLWDEETLNWKLVE